MTSNAGGNESVSDGLVRVKVGEEIRSIRSSKLKEQLPDIVEAVLQMQLWMQTAIFEEVDERANSRETFSLKRMPDFKWKTGTNESPSKIYYAIVSCGKPEQGSASQTAAGGANAHASPPPSAAAAAAAAGHGASGVTPELLDMLKNLHTPAGSGGTGVNYGMGAILNRINASRDPGAPMTMEQLRELAASLGGGGGGSSPSNTNPFTEAPARGTTVPPAPMSQRGGTQSKSDSFGSGAHVRNVSWSFMNANGIARIDPLSMKLSPPIQVSTVDNESLVYGPQFTGTIANTIGILFSRHRETSSKPLQPGEPSYPDFLLEGGVLATLVVGWIERKKIDNKHHSYVDFFEPNATLRELRQIAFENEVGKGQQQVRNSV
eukprot:tig00001343_g8328.t1